MKWIHPDSDLWILLDADGPCSLGWVFHSSACSAWFIAVIPRAAGIKSNKPQLTLQTGYKTLKAAQKDLEEVFQ